MRAESNATGKLTPVFRNTSSSANWVRDAAVGREVDAEAPREPCRHSAFDEVAARRQHRQVDRVLAGGLGLAGAGEQQVLDCGRLEGAIVGRAQHDLRIRHRPRDAEPRAERRVVHDERVVIPAQAGAAVNDPSCIVSWANSDCSVSVRRSLNAKTGRRPGIKGRRIGDRVVERLAHGRANKRRRRTSAGDGQGRRPRSRFRNCGSATGPARR